MLDGGTIITALSGAIGLSSGAVVLYVRATSAELRQELELARRGIIEHINGQYVRKDHCLLREEVIHARIDSLRHENGLTREDR